MPYVIKENFFAYISQVQTISQGSQTTFGIVMYRDVINDQLDLSNYDNVTVRLYDDQGIHFKTYSKVTKPGNDSLFIGNSANGEEGLIQFILDENDTANLRIGSVHAEIEIVQSKYIITSITTKMPKLIIAVVSLYVPGTRTFNLIDDKFITPASLYSVGSISGEFPVQGRISFQTSDPRNVTSIQVHFKDVRGYTNEYLDYVLSDLFQEGGSDSGVYMVITDVDRPYEYYIYDIISWEMTNDVMSGSESPVVYEIMVTYRSHSSSDNVLSKFLLNQNLSLSLDAYAAAGSKGDVGPQGPQGQKGDKGQKGELGLQGPAGPQGADSTVEGPTGEKGQKGEIGVGLQGQKGIQGDKGNKGEKGEVGRDGNKGSIGDKGDKGDQGEIGRDGSKGQKGEPGSTGGQGDTGAQGPQGDPAYSGIYRVSQQVDNNISKFLIENEYNPTLELFRGHIYRFNLGSDIQAGYHTFKFSETSGGTNNGGTEWTDGISNNGSYIEFTVPGDAPNTLYYYCDSTSTSDPDGTTNHAFEAGTINIVDFSTDALRGSGGPIGPQGPQGPQGAVGFQGVQGTKGDIGPQGPIGPQGAIGLQGIQGQKGEIGIQGTTGPVGQKGDKGDLGSQGQVGQKGEKGFDSSVPGPKGEKGDIGPIGPQGSTGDKGSASLVPGPQGPIGLQGIQGEKGDASTVPGPQGPQGAIGFQGLQGDKGDKGDKGDVGPQGDAGRDGITTGRIYYLNTSVSQSPTGYYEVDDAQTQASQQITNVTVSNNTSNVLVAQFVTDPGELDQYDFIPAGIQRFHLHFTKLNETDSVQIYVELLGANSDLSVISSMGVTEVESIGWDTNNTIPVEMDLDFAFPHTNLNTGDRMIVRIYANNPDNQSHAIKFYTEGTSDYSYVITTLGAISIEGPQGDKGDKGDKGADSTVVGPQGAIGPQGPVGLQGPVGATGAKGEVGPQGPVGSQGAAGTKGEIGVTGPQGDQGIQGTQGVKGQKGELGPTGVGGSEQFLLRLEYDQNEALISGNSAFVAATGYINPGAGTATVVSETVGTGNSGHYVTVSFNRSRPPISVFAYALDPKTMTYKVTHFDNDDIAQITYNTTKTAFTYQSTNEGGSGDVGQWAGTNFSASFSSYDMTIPVEQSVLKYGNSYSAPLQNRVDPHVYLIFTF